MKVVGLVSTFREGTLLRSAIESLAALDKVFVFEGPVEGNVADDDTARWLPPRSRRLELVTGAWPDDASKRTAMLQHVKATVRDPEGVWGLWLDGDEILLWGEYLRDWLNRAVQGGDSGNPVAGCPLPLVELDGSVAVCMGKLVRLDLIARYLVSSSYIELENGARRTVGNVDYWNPRDGALQFEDGKPHWRARPVLAGEPHLQHRWPLRPPGRRVERQHKAEERNYLEHQDEFAKPA